MLDYLEIYFIGDILKLLVIYELIIWENFI